MRTITSGSLLIIALFTFTVISCEKGEQEKTVSKQEVPQAVLEAFNAAYPGAAIKEYSEESENGQTYYEISCTFEGRKIDAVYNPDGSVSAIEEVIPVSSLPQAVTQAIAREVPQFSLNLAEKITKEGGTFYEVKLLNTKDQKNYELQFSNTGKLIEKEEKKNRGEMSEEEMEESEEGHEKISVPFAVTSAFNAKFSGAADIEWGKESDTEFEAEFKLNGKTISANFDEGGKWLETELKITENEMPATVRATLKSEYVDYRVLKAERLEKSAEPVTFEVKLAKGETTTEVVIDEAGKVLKKEVVKEEEEAEHEKENE